MVRKNIWQQFILKKLENTRESHQLRSLHAFDTIQPGYVIKEGKRLINLCSNDYLGLCMDKSSLEEAKILTEVVPTGAGTSRLLTGNLALHHELEKLLADWKKTESALVFPSGYQTNVGLIASLTGKGDAVFSDKLNHASIIDGCLLSGAAFHRYQHCDLKDLESLLRSKRPQKRLIVTDGVFSMDGDIAPLPEINKLAKRFNALLIVDEAHATGVLGEDGGGSWSHFHLPWGKHVILMGTLSKAIGCQGGYVCASQEIREYLVNFCRSFIYSTGLSPLLAGLAHFNISRIRSEKNLISSLNKSIHTMLKALSDAGLKIIDRPTPIIPIVIGESEAATHCAKVLYEKGIVAFAIRPPTVPEGTARLRLSVSAAHRMEDLCDAAKKIATTIQETNQIQVEEK